MADWDPELYNRFRRYRAEPAEAIFERLTLGRDERIVDLGCGGGENTIELARRSEGGSALGIDSSRTMIDHAIKLCDGVEPALRTRVAFRLGDFRDLDGEPRYSLIFSNAASQWVGDHRSVLARWYRALRPGGRIAVQIPANGEEAAQATIAALAQEEPWSALMDGAHVPSLTAGPPEEYRAMLGEIGFVDIDCYYQTFRHPMSSPAEIVEWMRATALRPFLERLPAERQVAFIAELTRRLERAYGTRGQLVFNFRRLFLWARHPEW
jgi:trans-aconitate 2-methyltransferase